MDSRRFDAFTRTLTPTRSRRGALATLLGGTLGLLGLIETAGKKRKGKKKRKKKKCNAGNCFGAQFTVEARWSNTTTDHDTYLFVPNTPGATLPSPFIKYNCGRSMTNAGALYPFAFTSGDATGPGDEVTTVKTLLAGAYEYWIELDESSPAGDLTVTLRNANGKVVRSWNSPANPSVQKGWHVFDIQGDTKQITSIDELTTSNLALADGAHAPNTDVCP